jgi:hypothetical protein
MDSGPTFQNFESWWWVVGGAMVADSTLATTTNLLKMRIDF